MRFIRLMLLSDEPYLEGNFLPKVVDLKDVGSDGPIPMCLYAILGPLHVLVAHLLVLMAGHYPA